ncbi:S9 family peptidase [Rhodanobacter sp. L36]|uniref:S9 family peptidase n=1 Tax=Rhodanobacter sp. L36 TaxID=1747221 RepID=UPI00131D89D5|nr:S9 family peptidase [Rhodanobacter sp. L36]
MKFVRRAICCTIFFLTCLDVRAAAPVFQLTDLQRIVALADPQISPDGKKIAVIVSTPDWKADKARKEIDLVDVVSGARRALIANRENLSSPRWSVDGARLAFLAKDPATKQTQVFVMPVTSDNTLRVTDNERGVDDYAWSPDGASIAFVAQDPPPHAEAIKANDKSFHVTNGHYLLTREVASWQLWVAPASGGKARQLTDGDFSLGTEPGGTTTPAWSHDGKRIAFTKFPGVYWASSFHSVIAEVDVASGGMRTLVSDETSGHFQFAPLGDATAYSRPRDGDRNNGDAIYVSTRGKTFDATATLARHFSTYAWMRDGQTLITAGALGTHTALWKQPLSGKATLLDLGDVEANDGLGTTTSNDTTSMSVSSTGAIAFIGTTANHPGELYVLDSIDAKPRRLTDVNAFIDSIQLGRTASIEWKGPNGFREDGVLVYPAGYEADRKYPLVLVIHGGPTMSSNAGFQRLAQLLAAAGFVVFQPNYRGSPNLGDAYQHAIYRNTGDGPGQDVMAGLAAVEKLGIVDERRIGVTGWSYGGYLTAWLTSHYDVWKAAVAGAPVTDWLMDYSISYYQEGDAYLLGSSPWTNAGWDIWRAQSPITYVRNVKAPTLILADVMDSNVPMVNAEEWYHGLRDNGVPVEFYAYPETSHLPHDIVQVSDIYRRWIGWMEKYLK